MKYWVHINNKVLGPYEEAELKNVEDFTHETLIYPEDAKEGETEWKPANEIIEIEPNTNSDTKAEFTIPESISKISAEKTIKESVDRLDKTLMSLKTTISKSAEMTSGEQNIIEKKLDELGKEMSAFRTDMKDFLDQTKKMNEELFKRIKEQPEPAIAPQPLSDSQKEDTIKLHIPAEEPKEDEEKLEEKPEDKTENVIGETKDRENDEKDEITVSLDKEENVKTLESSTETLKKAKEDLKDTIMEAQQYPDVQAEEDSENKKLEEEAQKEKEKKDGELEVVDIKTEQSLIKEEDKDKLKEEPKKDEEKTPEEKEKPEIENENNEDKKETLDDEADDNLKILERTIEEVKKATEKEKNQEEDDIVVEEEKKSEKSEDARKKEEIVESLLTPEEDSDDAKKDNKDGQNKTLSEMVLEDSTSVISDFLPTQNIDEKSSDELSKEEIENLAESIVTKNDNNTDDNEKSRIDLVSKGIDQSKMDHTQDSAKNRKKPKDIKTIPGDEEEVVSDSQEKPHPMDTLEEAVDKKQTSTEESEEKPKPEVVEDAKSDGTLVKPKSKYLLIILIIVLLIVAGYFMGFDKFLKNSYGSKKEGQIIQTKIPAVESEEALTGELETESGDETTMQDDGFVTSDDLVFPGEERIVDEGQPITETTLITPTAETTMEYEVKNHKLPTGLNLEETIINKHMKNKDKIAWQIQESVENNIYSIFVRVPPDNVNQTFATVYSLNYDAGTKVLTATNSEAKNLVEPTPISTTP